MGTKSMISFVGLDHKAHVMFHKEMVQELRYKINLYKSIVGLDHMILM